MKKKIAALSAILFITSLFLTSCRYQSRMMHDLYREVGLSEDEIREIDKQYEEEYDAAMNELAKELASAAEEMENDAEESPEAEEETGNGLPGSDDIDLTKEGAVDDLIGVAVGALIGSAESGESRSYLNEEGHLVVLGKDMGYGPGEYFSTTGKACKCHGRHTCGEAPDCTCIEVSGACQCYGFAMWCQEKLFGYNDRSKKEKFDKLPALSNAQMGKDGSGLKEYLYGVAKPGSHIRTSGNQHSMLIMSIDENGFRVAQANGQKNEEYKGLVNCRIGTKYYTWQEYATTTYGQRGIANVWVPLEIFEGVVDKPVDDQGIAMFEDVIVEGWAQFARELPEVYCVLNNDEKAVFGPGAPYDRADGRKGFQIRVPFKEFKNGRNSYVVVAVDALGERHIMKEGYLEYKKEYDIRELFKQNLR